MSAPEMPAWLLPPVAWQGPPVAQKYSEPAPLSHAALLEFRDSLHEDSCVYAASGAEIDLWLAQLDEAIDSGLVDERPSWEIEAAEQAERVAAIVVATMEARGTRVDAAGTDEYSRSHFLTRKQAAARVGCSLRKFDTDVRKQLPSYSVGKSFRFKVEDIDSWLEAQKGGNSSVVATSTAYASRTRAAATRSPRARALLQRLLAPPPGSTQTSSRGG